LTHINYIVEPYARDLKELSHQLTTGQGRLDSTMK